jgi:hypothetical protein
MVRNFSDTTADTFATASVVSTIASFSTEVQPIISLMAGLVAVFSGLFAIRYYYIKSKRNGENQ